VVIYACSVLALHTGSTVGRQHTPRRCTALFVVPPSHSCRPSARRSKARHGRARQLLLIVPPGPCVSEYALRGANEIGSTRLLSGQTNHDSGSIGERDVLSNGGSKSSSKTAEPVRARAALARIGCGQGGARSSKRQSALLLLGSRSKSRHSRPDASSTVRVTHRFGSATPRIISSRSIHIAMRLGNKGSRPRDATMPAAAEQPARV